MEGDVVEECRTAGSAAARRTAGQRRRGGLQGGGGGLREMKRCPGNNTYRAKGNMGIIEKTSILREQMILKKI
jgi:hypothetical protein